MQQNLKEFFIYSFNLFNSKKEVFKVMQNKSIIMFVTTIIVKIALEEPLQDSGIQVVKIKNMYIVLEQIFT